MGGGSDLLESCGISSYPSLHLRVPPPPHLKGFFLHSRPPPKKKCMRLTPQNCFGTNVTYARNNARNIRQKKMGFMVFSAIDPCFPPHMPVVYTSGLGQHADMGAVEWEALAPPLPRVPRDASSKSGGHKPMKARV